MSKRSGKKKPASKPAAGSTPPRPSEADIDEVHRLLVRYQTRIRGRLPVLLLSLLTALLLTLSFEPVGWWPLGWLAMVPWLVAIATATRFGWMLFCSYLGGFVFFAFNLWWLAACGSPGPAGGVALMYLAVLALALYLGLYFLAFAYVVGGLLRRWGERDPLGPPSRLMMCYLVPVAWIGTEILRGYVMTGFPWFLLGHTQYEITWLAQLADLGGAYAVGAVVAAVNGLIADGMLQPLFLPTKKGPRPNYEVSAATLALMGVLLFSLVYGRWRIQTWPDHITPGPRVAVVQDYYPISLASPESVEAWMAAEEDRFNVHFAHSRSAARLADTPDLIAWPETMVGPWILNDEYLDLPFRDDASRQLAESRAKDRKLRQHAAGDGAAVLVGGISLVPVPADWIEKSPGRRIDLSAEPVGVAGYDNPQIHRRNSAILYQPVWEDAAGPTTRPGEVGNVVKSRYDKHHLVPFGEQIPFRESWPAAFRLLRKTTPMQLLVPGPNPGPMALTTREGEEFHFAAAICYEDVMPQATRRLVWRDDGQKLADFIVNISNDGWFAGTPELEQHYVSATFRCIENRTPMARSVNGGYSGFIDSLGRPMGDGPMLPQKKGSRARVLQIDDRVTIYSRIGDSVGWLCAALLGAGVVAVFLRRRKAKRAT